MYPISESDTSHPWKKYIETLVVILTSNLKREVAKAAKNNFILKCKVDVERKSRPEPEESF